MNEGYSVCLNEWALDKDIKNELGLLLIISSLTAENGYCYASNKYLSELFKVAEKSISRKINRLIKKGYIVVNYEKKGCEVISREIRLKNFLTDDPQKCYYESQKCYSTGNKNVTDNNISIKNKKEIYKEKILNDNNFTDKFKNTLIEWLEYKKYSYEELGFKKLLTIIKNNLKEYSEEEVIDVIDESIANNYKGITFDKLNKNFRKVKKEETKMVNDDGVYRIL